MLNYKWLSPCPFFVLTLGLISCTKPETQEINRLQIPQPHWLLAGGPSVSFDEGLNPIAFRDPADALSFEDAPRAELHVDAECLDKDGVMFKQSSNSHLPGILPLYTLISPELLNPHRLAREKKISCLFEFKAVNSDGAVHKFSIRNLAIVDQALSSDIVMLGGHSAPLHERDFQQIHFTHQSGKSLPMELWCEDFHLSSPHLHSHEISLAEFEVNDTLRAHPSQECRLLALEEGRVKLMSLPFAIQLEAVQPIITIEPVHAFIDDDGRIDKATDQHIPMPFLHLHFKNNNGYPIYFSLVKPSHEYLPLQYKVIVKIGATILWCERMPVYLPDSHYSVVGNSMPYDHINTVLLPHQNSSILVTETETEVAVTLGPSTTLNIDFAVSSWKKGTTLGHSVVFIPQSDFKIKNFQLESDGTWTQIGDKNFGTKEISWVTENRDPGFQPNQEFARYCP
jgi:hypothetical protein